MEPVLLLLIFFTTLFKHNARRLQITEGLQLFFSLIERGYQLKELASHHFQVLIVCHCLFYKLHSPFLNFANHSQHVLLLNKKFSKSASIIFVSAAVLSNLKRNNMQCRTSILFTAIFFFYSKLIFNCVFILLKIKKITGNDHKYYLCDHF